MSFTFTNSPATSNRDAVRILVDDRTETGHQLSDETIAWLLSSESSVWYAAAAAAETIAGQYASAVHTKKVGDLALTFGGSIAGTDPASLYRARAIALRRTAATKGNGPYSGGISRSDVAAQVADTDWTGPRFVVGQFDNPPNLATSTSTGVLVF